MEDAAAQKKQAMITSLRLLTATAKSRAELATRLKDKGYGEEVIEETLKSLESQGLLNDKSFAQNLKSRFTLSKPSGTRKIDFELKRKGIPSKIREEVLSEILPEEETERAKELALSRWERLKSLPTDKRKKRVYDFLLRRGFDYRITRDVMNEIERFSEC